MAGTWFRLLPAVLVGVSVGCAPAAKPDATVTIREADAIDPKDLGIEKFVFEVKVPVGKVMVLRCTEEHDGRKEDRVSESIDYANGGVARQVVLVYDSLSFPFNDGLKDKVRVRTKASDSVLPDLQRTNTTVSPGQLTLTVSKNGKDPIVLTFDCFVEDYEAARKRHPDLKAEPDAGPWTYCGTVRAK